MQLKCGQCGAPFRAADLHLDRGIAVCSSCHSVQRLPESTTSDSRRDEAPQTVRTPRGDVPIPERCTIEDDGHELTIRIRWFQWGLFFLLFFAIGWNSFLVGWYWELTSGAFAGNNGMPGAFKLIFFVFPIGHVAVGVGLSYFVLAGFLNSSVIRVADGVLSVRNGPLPWRGNLDLPIDGIEQFVCREKVTPDSDGGAPSVQHEVRVVVSGHERKLLTGLPQTEHALFVEQRLERFLRLADRAMPDEMSAM